METNVLGREVAKVRKMKNLTQEQLGRRIGLPKSSICKIENGRTRLTWEDAAIMMEAMGEALVLPSLEAQNTAAQEQKARMLTSAVEWFATDRGMTLAEAYRYLLTFSAIDYLVRNWRYEQTLPKETILEDIAAICRHNGGLL